MEVETIEKEVSTGMDMEAASDSVSDLLFPPGSDDVETETQGKQEGPIVAAPDASSPPTLAPAPEVVADPAPKSWPKEMHEHWGKVPKEVQTYWQTREKQMLDGLEQYKGAAQYGKALNDVLSPYQPILQSKGLDAPRAVADLMQAYVGLTQGTHEQRREIYDKIGKNFGLTSRPASDPSQQTQVDPRIQSLEERLQQFQQVLTAQQTESYKATLAKANEEVSTFAADPLHQYFDECSDHILRLIGAGYSLQEAYDTAVMANPSTKSKEIVRIQTEYEAKLKENARLQSLPKRQARSVNIGGRDTHRAPTEPLGSMEEEMKKVQTEIRSRASH